MNPSQLTVFREANATNSTTVLTIKEGIKRRYSKCFLTLIELMLTRDPEKRRNIDHLEIDYFIDEAPINLDEEKFEPDVELIIRDFR